MPGTLLRVADQERSSPLRNAKPCLGNYLASGLLLLALSLPIKLGERGSQLLRERSGISGTAKLRLGNYLLLTIAFAALELLLALALGLHSQIS